MIDPAIGSWSDGMQTRFGRQHALTAGSIVPFCLLIFGLFWPPEGRSELGLFAWLTVFTIGTRAGLAVFHVPYQSLGTAPHIPRLAGSRQPARPFSVRQMYADIIEAIGHIALASLAGAIVGLFFIPWFIGRFDKKWTVVIGMLVSGAFTTGPIVLHLGGWMTTDVYALEVTLAALGFLAALIGVQATVSVASIMGGIADEYELTHGRRAPEGCSWRREPAPVKVTNRTR